MEHFHSKSIFTIGSYYYYFPYSFSKFQIFSVFSPSSWNVCLLPPFLLQLPTNKINNRAFSSDRKTNRKVEKYTPFLVPVPVSPSSLSSSYSSSFFTTPLASLDSPSFPKPPFFSLLDCYKDFLHPYINEIIACLLKDVFQTWFTVLLYIQ
jgi:hypothetical protein